MSEEKQKVLGKMYVGRCFNCGKVVYGAIADTPADQDDCATDIKRLLKDGYTVELIDLFEGEDAPGWCLDHKQCKKEFRQRKVKP